LMSFKNELEL